MSDISFPLHFYKPEGPGPDPELDARYQQLEQFCNRDRDIQNNENQLRILRHDHPNSYRGGLTAEEVVQKFQAVSGSLEWQGCLSPGSSFCADQAHLQKLPCYCRHIFDGYEMAPVYFLHIPNFGLGCFAHRMIKKGEYLMDLQGEFCRLEDVDDAEGGLYSMEVTTGGKSIGIELDASRVGGLGRFLNHSCEANVESFPVLIGGRVRVPILATKDIQSGQQLCWDYGAAYFTNRGLVCYCGNQGCKVKPVNQEDKENRDAYLRFLNDLHGPPGQQMIPTPTTADSRRAHREACRLALEREKEMMSSSVVTVTISNPVIPEGMVHELSPELAAILSSSHSIQKLQFTIALNPGSNVKKEVKKIESVKVADEKLIVTVEEPTENEYGVCSGMEHSGLAPIDPTTLYIGNLPSTVTTPELERMFNGTNYSGIGTMRSPPPGEEFIPGYVKYRTPQEALSAFGQNFHKVINGKGINLRFMRVEQNGQGNWIWKE